MNREFLDLYNRELDLFYEHAAEFAEEYPEIAKRLGGLIRDRADPMAAGLLEGAAFLAARVQLKIKHEFPEFANNLLEQLVPNYLAPTPSAMLVKALPKYGDSALAEGRLFPRGAQVDATYVEADKEIACRYTLTAPIRLWPFYIKSAEYYTSAAALQPLKINLRRETIAGMRITLVVATTSDPSDDAREKTAPRQPWSLFSDNKATELPIYLAGAEAHANQIYEQIFGHCTSVWFRYLDANNDATVIEAPKTCLRQLGMEESESLLPKDDRIFRGFDLVHEYFMFSRKFLGFELALDREKVTSRLPSRMIDIIFGFDEVNASLAASVQKDMFALYAAPAVNLFEMATDRVSIKANQHEYHVVPDKSRYLDYEPHRLIDVFAHFPGSVEKRPVRPLYASSTDLREKNALQYTIRRAPRRRTIEEKRYGPAGDYFGTDLFISLSDTGSLSQENVGVAELSIRALCSNRHLPEHLPIGQNRVDFRLADDVELDLVCVAGPTRPGEPIVSYQKRRSETAHTGAVSWRLINILSLNHLGLTEREAGENARALREILTTFTEPNDAAGERRVRGVLSVDSRPIVRRIRCGGGVGPARGTEVTVTLDEKAFEGTGAFLLGAILDRFYCEYAAFNHFTQLVLRTTERGEIMRWPARLGARRAL
ncbi:type VI secretion system baseplate subunit TssF [Methylosinus sp. Ce-a6]|uniref:type VI secretion system baseplate subunit TssF n=1 Tax=Methylosinus sp. Ce-a6 TaxID=2172005 RepID=UPI00135AA611|nr:type VI secretion system baseplate subunit TssF [Methylosinus sp. Ce-a6]